MQRTTLRPSILVSLKTSIRGGVSYEREEIDEHADGAAHVAEWRTKSRIEDADEHERAKKVRGKARSLVAGVCAKTAFGLMCPISKEDKMNEAIAEAQALAAAFNATAKYSQIDVYVMSGRVLGDDEQAVRAISSEVRDLLDEMSGAIDRLDPAAIRDAANRARQVGMVLDSEQAKRVQGAIDAARTAAKAIVKRVEKGGEEASAVLLETSGANSVISAARMSFLDFDAPDADAEALPSANLQRFDGLEFDDADVDDAATAETGDAPELDFSGEGEGEAA